MNTDCAVCRSLLAPTWLVWASAGRPAVLVHLCDGCADVGRALLAAGVPAIDPHADEFEVKNMVVEAIMVERMMASMRAL